MRYFIQKRKNLHCPAAAAGGAAVALRLRGLKIDFRSQPTTKPNQTKPNQAKPSQAKPSQAKPNQAKPNQTKRNQTKPNIHSVINNFAFGSRLLSSLVCFWYILVLTPKRVNPQNSNKKLVVKNNGKKYKNYDR